MPPLRPGWSLSPRFFLVGEFPKILFTTIDVSTVLFWGKNQYWFSFRNLLEYRWWFILSVNSCSSIFPSMFIRLMGLYFPASLSSSLSGLTMGRITDLFHCFGKCPRLKHLYICVKTVGKLLCTCRSISLDRASSPGALRGSNFSSITCTSCLVI